MSFSIGITYWPVQEGFCDVILTKDLTVKQLQDILDIVEPVLLRCDGTLLVLDTISAISTVVGPENRVVLDRNLLHYGTKQFGEGAIDPKLHFIRLAPPYTGNGIIGNGIPAENLHTFLFSP